MSIKMNKKEEITKALTAIENLLVLHQSEQEGISSGQPTIEQWIKAVEEGHEALQSLKKINILNESQVIENLIQYVAEWGSIEETGDVRY